MKGGRGETKGKSMRQSSHGYSERNKDDEGGGGEG